ncbi:hypothetical protein LCGC14_2584770, partial [marine sediment metagenome]
MSAVDTQVAAASAKRAGRSLWGDAVHRIGRDKLAMV